jgi:hypothetical protein
VGRDTGLSLGGGAVVTGIQTKPPDDKIMWKRLKARVHPDAGESYEDFIWVSHLEEVVCSGFSEPARTSPSPQPHRPEPPPTDDRPRVPFITPHDFEELTRTALRYAHQNAGTVYSDLLLLLTDCHSLSRMRFEEQRGASYRRFAAIGHRVGMDLEERREWYSLAESIPLSDRHAGHILSKLKRQAA